MTSFIPITVACTGFYIFTSATLPTAIGFGLYWPTRRHLAKTLVQHFWTQEWYTQISIQAIPLLPPDLQQIAVVYIGNDDYHSYVNSWVNWIVRPYDAAVITSLLISHTNDVLTSLNTLKTSIISAYKEITIANVKARAFKALISPQNKKTSVAISLGIIGVTLAAPKIKSFGIKVLSKLVGEIDKAIDLTSNKIIYIANTLGVESLKQLADAGVNFKDFTDSDIGFLTDSLGFEALTPLAEIGFDFSSLNNSTLLYLYECLGPGNFISLTKLDINPIDLGSSSVLDTGVEPTTLSCGIELNAFWPNL